MTRFDQPLSWSVSADSFVPLLYEGETIGICKREIADRVAAILNEQDTYRKAMLLACYDLIARSGSTLNPEDLMQQYLSKAERPKSGTGAIVLLLKQRQTELDLTDEEFSRFCNTFRLSREEVRNLYAGEAIESNQLGPLSRILGITVDELLHVWKGD